MTDILSFLLDLKRTGHLIVRVWERMSCEESTINCLYLQIFPKDLDGIFYTKNLKIVDCELTHKS